MSDIRPVFQAWCMEQRLKLDALANDDFTLVGEVVQEIAVVLDDDVSPRELRYMAELGLVPS